MSRINRIISACGRLLGIAFTLLKTGRLPAGEDDTKAEKVIQALGGKVERSPAAPERPIISMDFNGTKVTDAGLKELASLKSLQELHLASTMVTDVGLKELASLESLQTLD